MFAVEQGFGVIKHHMHLGNLIIQLDGASPTYLSQQFILYNSLLVTTFISRKFLTNLPVIRSADS